MKYFLLSIGCQMNLSDSERICSVLDAMGYERTDDEEQADLLGVVSCSVRQRAIDRVYSRIARWNRWKDDRNLLTFISGCVLPTDKERFLELFDILFPINDLPQFPDMVRQYGVVTPLATQSVQESGHSDPLGGFWKIAPRYESTFEAYIPIQNGCDKFCTFCAVPYTRGREVSRPSDDILDEAQSLVDRGYRSITLLGQNVNSYGLDKPGKERSFPQLMRELGVLGERSGREFWVYFTSPHPRDVTRELLETVAAYPVLANQIHLPIQSGDDKILIRMNRNYRLEEYREVVRDIRHILPKATLFTDIIVGFTGESQEQFEATRGAMREFRYNMAYVAMYSPRPGAASARWADDVPLVEKKRRLQELSEELKVTALTHNQALVGSTVRVLITGLDRKPGYLSGRTEGRIPVRLPATIDASVGQFADVTITEAQPLSVAGEILRGLKSAISVPS